MPIEQTMKMFSAIELNYSDTVCAYSRVIRCYKSLINIYQQGQMQDLKRGGGKLGLHAKGGGSSFGPNVKNPTSCTKRGGGAQTPGPPPPIRYWCR